MAKLDIVSYQNNLLHSAVYAAILALALPKRKDDTATTSASEEEAQEFFFVWSLSSILGYVIAVLAGVCLVLEIRYMMKRRRLPPGDSGIPLIGHLWDEMKNAEEFYVRRIQNYGPISTQNVLMTPAVLVTDEEDVLWAMKLERRGTLRGFMLPHFRKLLGEEAILFKSGDDHRRMRKIFEPAFSPKTILNYAGIMDKTTKQQLACWCDSNQFQESREWAILAMKIFFFCAFGETDDDRLTKLTHLIDNWMAGCLAPIPFEIPGTSLATAHAYKKELDMEFQNMINEFKRKNPPGSDGAKQSVMGRLCYAVQEDGSTPTDKQLLDNLRVFVFAGYDTTKASFSAIAHFLKHHPDAEELLRKEAQTMGGPEEPLDVEKLKNDAPILNAFLAETWRLMAPLAIHATTATEDIEYKGYYIPKGTFVVYSIQAHNKMNNELYPKAKEFCYQRWLPKDHPLYDPSMANTEEIDYNVMSSKFRSFNLGPHMCLGAHFAKQEVRIVLTRLLQSYKIETRNEVHKPFPLKQILSDFKLTPRE